MKKETFTLTPEQIKEWKGKYGSFYKLTAESGEVCFIKDPCSSLIVMAAATEAMQQSTIAFVQTILANCFLDGDEAMKTDPGIQLGLLDQVNQITDLPEMEIVQKGLKYVVSGFGFEVSVRGVDRDTITQCEQRNATKKPFKTAIYILEKVVIDMKELDAIRANEKAYLGLIMAVDKLKEKKLVIVEKF